MLKCDERNQFTYAFRKKRADMRLAADDASCEIREVKQYIESLGSTSSHTTIASSHSKFSPIHRINPRKEQKTLRGRTILAINGASIANAYRGTLKIPHIAPTETDFDSEKCPPVERASWLQFPPLNSIAFASQCSGKTATERGWQVDLPASLAGPSASVASPAPLPSICSPVEARGHHRSNRTRKKRPRVSRQITGDEDVVLKKEAAGQARVWVPGSFLDIVKVHEVHRHYKTRAATDTLWTGERAASLMQTLPVARARAYEIVEVEHAVERIQSVYRGFQARMRVWGRDGMHWNANAVRLQCAWRSTVARRKLNFLVKSRHTYAATQIQRVVRGHQAKMFCARKRERLFNTSATHIQRHWRGVLGRRYAAHIRILHVNTAAIVIQRTWRGKIGRRLALSTPEANRNEIAKIRAQWEYQCRTAKSLHESNERDSGGALDYAMYLILIVKNYRKAQHVLQVGLAIHPQDASLLSAYALLLMLLDTTSIADLEDSLNCWIEAEYIDSSSMIDGAAKRRSRDFTTSLRHHMDRDWLWAATKLDPDNAHYLACYAIFLTFAFAPETQHRANRFFGRALAGFGKMRRDYIDHAYTFYETVASRPRVVIQKGLYRHVEVTITKWGSLWEIAAEHELHSIASTYLDERDMQVISKKIPHDILEGKSDTRIASALLRLLQVVRRELKFKFIVPSIARDRLNRKNVALTIQAATMLQSAVRGMRVREDLRKKRLILEEQRRQHLTFLQRKEDRRKWLWLRLQAALRVKAMFQGFRARSRLKKMQRSAIKVQAVFRGFKVRHDIAEEKRRKALGVHAETIYHRAHNISGRYLIVTVQKAGLNYVFTGYDVENNATSKGWVLSKQVKELLSIYPYGIEGGYHKVKRLDFEDALSIVSAPPHPSKYNPAKKIATIHTPATPRRMLREAYLPPAIDPPASLAASYLIQRKQKNKLTSSNHDGVLKMLLSMLALTDGIKLLSEVRSDDGKVGHKVLTVNPVFGASVRGRGVLAASNAASRISRLLPDQVKIYEEIKKTCGYETDQDVLDIDHMRSNYEKLRDYNETVEAQRAEARRVQQERERELALLQARQAEAEREMERRRRISQANVMQRMAASVNRVRAGQPGQLAVIDLSGAEEEV